MASTRLVKAGLGGTALALLAMTGIGFAPTPTQLPTVTVHLSPT